MSAKEDKIGTLEELFKSELKEPFHYKLSLTDVRNNTKDIFESMRKMYTMGLVIHFGNEEKVLFPNINRFIIFDLMFNVARSGQYD